MATFPSGNAPLRRHRVSVAGSRPKVAERVTVHTVSRAELLVQAVAVSSMERTQNLCFTPSYRDVEDLLAERGLDVSCETIRRWVRKFGPLYARTLRRRRPRLTRT